MTLPAAVTSWHSLTALVNEIKSPSSFVSRLLYSNSDPRPTKQIQFDLLIGSREVAPFVKRNGPAAMVSKYDSKPQTVEPPHIRVKHGLQPDELLMNREPGSVIYVGEEQVMDGAQRKVARSSQKLSDIVAEAEEYLACQALTGTISYEVDEEAAFEVVFPRTSSHNISSISPFWDQGSSSPITDCLTAKKLVSEDAGLPITDMILGSEAMTAFLKNAEVASFLDLRRVDAGQLALQNQFLESGAIALGQWEGMRVWGYPRTTSVAGSSVNLIRAKYAEFVCALPAAENVMYYGVISDIDAMQARQIVGRRFSKSWIEKDPSLWVQLLESNPLPVPRRPDSTVSMKVVSG